MLRLKGILVLFEQLPESRVCHSPVTRSGLNVPINFLKTIAIQRKRTARKEEVWCKEAKEKEADRRNKNTVFEGRPCVVSYTAKVNMEKS